MGRNDHQRRDTLDLEAVAEEEEEEEEEVVVVVLEEEVGQEVYRISEASITVNPLYTFYFFLLIFT
jgi:predicted SpoU family rRNA methylase